MPIGIVGSQRLYFFEYLVAGNAVLGYPHISPFRGATIVTLNGTTAGRTGGWWFPTSNQVRGRFTLAPLDNSVGVCLITS